MEDNTMTNEQLKNEIISRFKPIISSWDASDIYAISFFVYDFRDNPREPTVTLGYNTEEWFREYGSSEDDEKEARWNYAFWIQNRESVFGEPDETGTHEIVREWIKSNNLIDLPDEKTTEEEIDENDPEAVMQRWIKNNTSDDLSEKVTKKFIDVLVDVSKELHETGFIQDKFGKTIPIIIHELEYYDEIARQNERANPSDAVSDFVTWIDKMYG